MFRHYFIFEQLALLEEWKCIILTSQCLCRTILVTQYRKKDQALESIMTGVLTENLDRKLVLVLCTLVTAKMDIEYISLDCLLEKMT